MCSVMSYGRRITVASASFNVESKHKQVPVIDSRPVGGKETDM